MHRTEGLYNENNLFVDGPPGSRVTAAWLNAVQEELAYVIEQAGFAMETANTETSTQLWAVLQGLTAGGMTTISVADDDEIILDVAKTGWGIAQAGDNEEWIQFRFTSAGVITAINNTANAVITDLDGNFCVYDNGTGIAIKNRLGGVKVIRYQISYSA